MGTIHEPKYGPIQIPKDTQEEEPGFLLRGQDQLASLAIMFYAGLVRAASWGTDDPEKGKRLRELAGIVETRAEELNLWQLYHDTRLPD